MKTKKALNIIKVVVGKKWREYQKTLEDRVNKGVTKPMGVNLKKLEQRYMKEQRGIEDNHLAQQPTWLLNNMYFAMMEIRLPIMMRKNNNIRKHKKYQRR